MNEPIILPSARRWPFLVAGIVAGIALAAGAVALRELDSGTDGVAVAGEVTLVSAPVEQRDLIEEVEWVADLTYGTSVQVSAPADGTVTASADVGAVLRRGDVVVEIDELPVTVLFGAVPAWRNLANGDEGSDVQQMETNLVALGFDPDGEVSVDTEFDADTEDMVEAWQESLGFETTGVFATEHVVIVEGPVAVVEAPAVGTPVRSGDSLAQVSARAETTTVVAQSTGTVSEVVEVGAPLSHGALLFMVDDIEVRAVFGLEPVARLSLDDGIEREFILLAEEQQFASVLVADGDVLETPRPTLEISLQTLSVIVPVGLADQGDWSAGQPVEIVLPDDSTVAGVVTDVGTVAQDVGQGQTPTVDVTVEVLDLVDDDLPASEVTVIVAGQSVLAATVVPTRALVTLAEGGFAVEQVHDDGTTTLVAIETGTFDDGVVEVIDSTLRAGDLVAVPS